MHPQIEDQLDEALDAMLGRGPKSLHELLESFPADSGIRDLLLAAGRARFLLAANPPPLVRARDLAQLTLAARALQRPQKAWQPKDMARYLLAATPPPDVRARHLTELMMAARALQVMVTARTLQGRQKVWQPRRTSRLRALVLRPIAVLAVVAAMMVAPLVALASATGPGDALYGTKLALERVELAVELALERDPVEDVKLHLKFADRRISELSELRAEGWIDEIGRVMASLNPHLGEAEDGISDLKADGQPVVSLQAHLTQILSKHLTVLEGLVQNAECDSESPEVGNPQCKGLLNALENSSKVLQEVPGATQRKAGRGRPETVEDAHGRPARQGPATGPAGEVTPPGKSGGVTSDPPGRGHSK